MGNILSELLPRKVRLWIYLAVLIAALLLAAWQATEGNLLEFLIAVATALQSGLAASNVNPAPTDLRAAPDEALAIEVDNRGKTVVDSMHYGWMQNQVQGTLFNELADPTNIPAQRPGTVG